ncbi:uncharacterized protein LOC112515053 [Cynara cardunculus var. scolymus]|uniref:Uncharacterized protein n=1 Tax=Cynara cardunculus var. scolymus TaxID=59895 RepID=A0A103XKK4_CYNCS|nr:uncharacterized protein LOC112515053 [Cynara cardunculus var. scolymus]KVH92309.1 hypothetical protein Ccrd_005652 [Cynara cardunculus var. scolymus]
MGSSESSLSSSQKGEDGITIVSERFETMDPVLEKLKSLRTTTPILMPKLTKSDLTNVLVKKPPSSSDTGIVDPKVILDLFSTYQEWQEQQAHNINKRQEALEDKIKAIDALAIKLLKKYKSSASAVKTTSRHLSGVDQLQVEVGELKGRLTEVVNNCDSICKRIAVEGPESLHSSVKPFTSLSSVSKNPPLP